MKRRIWGIVFVWMMSAVMLAGCGEMESERNTEKSPEGSAVSVAELQEDMPGNGMDGAVQVQPGAAEVPAVSEMNATEAVSRMLCIDGEIYYDTGRISDALRCGLMDHVIDSSVPAGEIPTEDNQSNFGTGYGYQRWTKGQVHIDMDDGWHIFQASEAYRLTVTNGNNGELVELERSPVFWEIIEKCSKLDVTKSENQVDRTGYSYCLRLFDKDNNLLSTVTPLGLEINIDGVYYQDSGYGTTYELNIMLDTLFEEAVPEATATQKAGSVDTLENVSMQVTCATNEGASVVFVNDSDKNLQFGSDYELHMLKDGEWYAVDYIIEDWAVNAIAYVMPKGKPVSTGIKWTYFHGTLPAGHYRIVKGVTDFRGSGDFTEYQLAAEFEVE